MHQATVIQHVGFEDLGSLAGVLSTRDYHIKYVLAPKADLHALDPLEPDLLIVLGGPVGAYDQDSYPFLSAEVDLLRVRLEDDRPTLGICLGAQLMVRALHAKVYAGTQVEIGWSPVTLTEAGRASPLAELGEQEPVFHWHQDTFDLPKGAVHLASTPQYAHQGFEYKRRSLALQFHPEVTALGLETWYVGYSHELAQTPGVSAVNLRHDAKRYAEDLERRAARMWTRWLDTVSDD